MKRQMSPLAVLVAVPAIVLAAGIAVMLLGRRATSDASEELARKQLAAQASDVQHDVALALDQAAPILDRLRVLADPSLLIDEVAPRMVELMIGRPGVANISIGFASGRMRGTFVPEGAPGDIQVLESVVADGQTQRTDYQVVGGVLRQVATRVTGYDVRKRPHYTLAATAKVRSWTPPRVYFSSRSTGVSATEPLYGADGALAAVITVDFDVAALSQFLASSPVQGARTVVVSADGAILAFPSAPVPAAASRDARLLRATDYDDPALTSLIAALGETRITRLTFLDVATPQGRFLASITPLGGKRAGVTAPLDWYLASLVPETSLLGPTQRMQAQGLLASAVALVLALGVALLLAWNVLRMRREVSTADAAARSARERIAELGAYRLLGRLGVGGMGEVWRAEHRLIARQAAVKLVRAEALVDPWHRRKARERFRREAQTLAQMKSRHTIGLYDYGVADDGTFYYVMELLDGLDLDKLVRETGSISAARTIHILIGACQSLAEAHEAGLLHRDIKPANIFLCRAADEVDIVKVLDFGIVQTLGEPTADPADIISLPAFDAALPPTTKLTRDGAMVGTPGYIAPEQARGELLDVRSDLYALGCVAWWLLAGREVFDRPDDRTAIQQHVEAPLPALRDHVTQWLPQELETLVAAMLAKDPEDRPASARVLAAALRRIVVPEQHAWTQDRAHAWWAMNKPVAVRHEEVIAETRELRTTVGNIRG